MMMTTVQCAILLAILTICNCQEYHIKPDKCLQEECCSYPPPDCMTLSEYVLSTTYYNNLILSPGEYYLNSTFSIISTSTNTQDFSIIGSGSENTKIICTQDATLEASLFDTLTIENVSFVSCGVDTTPGVSLNNIDIVNLTDISFSESTSGALDIQNCFSVHLTSLKIINNINSQHTIVSVKNSPNIILNDLLVANNSIGKLDSSCTYTSFLLANEVIFRIESSFLLNSQDIQVLNNVGPFGVMVIANIIEINAWGDWIFEQNLVCFNGSLAFFTASIVSFNGSLIFNDNKGTDVANEGTGGLFIQESTLNLFGLVEFTGNEGYIACFMSIAAQLNISKGAMIIQNNSNSSLTAVSLQRESKLTINDTLIIEDNKCRQRMVSVENSIMIVTGVINITNNFISPLSIFSSKLVLNGTLYFTNNSGIMYASKSEIEIHGDSTFIHNSIEDGYSDGTLGVVLSTLLIEGTYTFKDNIYDIENGGGIFCSIGCTVTLGGTGYFMNNHANNGGGIFIDQLSRLELKKDARLYFINNTAIKGAGIFIVTTVQRVQCSSSQTDCLFGLEDSNNPNVSLTFEQNKANPGASIIHVNFDHIEDRNNHYPALIELNKTIDVVSSTNNSLPLFTSDSRWFCFCEDDSRENCNRNDLPENITGYKGTSFSVKARVLKFYGTEMSEPVRASLESSLSAVGRTLIGNSRNSSIIANNGRLQSASAVKCENFTFRIKSTADSETLVMNVGESFLDTEKLLKINVRFNPFCPPGFPLNEEGNSCECDESIKNFLKSCEITDETFSKKPEYASHWMAPSKDSRFKESAMSWYDGCPNRYCITDGNFTFSDDGICANNRAGRLCGECKANYSLLLGGDRCGDCSNNAYLALILVFAVVGVLLIAFIFLTQITVTTGTINGLIFYVNILNSNQSLFFPDGFFPVYYVVISWLNLNFGIEICFFDGMNQITYAVFQFVFPFYLWFLAGTIIFLCRYSDKVSRFFGSSDPVAVLATIILLSFNSLVQNIVNIFYFSALNLPDGNMMNVWTYDGSVVYARGSHLVLLVVSSVFLFLFLFPYALVLLTAPLLQKSDYGSKFLRKLKLQPFIQSYHVPFKPQHRYWVGLCLFIRAMLLIAFSVGESRDWNLFLIITACVGAISMFTITGGIYDKKWIDKLEIFFLINLGVLAAATSFSYSPSINGQTEIATYISITVALLTFIGIVLLHIFWRLKKFKKVNKFVKLINKKLNFSKKQNLDINQSTSTGDKDDASISTIGTTTTTTFQVELREPLLESLVD